MPSSKAYAIILAGGQGDRFQASAKAFEGIFRALPRHNGQPILQGHPRAFKQNWKILGQPVTYFSAEALQAVASLEDTILVKHQDSPAQNTPPGMASVTGGETRQQSTIIGLEWLIKHRKPAKHSIVLIHDAARPMVLSCDVMRLFTALEHSPAHIRGAILSSPIASTIKSHSSGVITATLPRGTLIEAQTPQAFYLHEAAAMHNSSSPSSHTTTDNAQLYEHSSLDVIHIPSSGVNTKITTIEDAAIAAFILYTRRPQVAQVVPMSSIQSLAAIPKEGKAA